jgi:hypothetical protein
VSEAEERPAAEPAAGPPAGSAEQAEPRRVWVHRRRAPKYRAFGVSGALLGVAVGLAVGLLKDKPEGADYTTQAIAGYFATIFGLIGALAGLAAALLAERLTSRR